MEEIEARPAGGSGPADVVVVGAGYAGVELASTVAERLGTRAAVQLVSAGSIPPSPSPSPSPAPPSPLAFPHPSSLGSGPTLCSAHLPSSHFLAVLSCFLSLFASDTCISSLQELHLQVLALDTVGHCYVWCK